jgi:hypothetical protein
LHCERKFVTSRSTLEYLVIVSLHIILIHQVPPFELAAPVMTTYLLVDSHDTELLIQWLRCGCDGKIPNGKGFIYKYSHVSCEICKMLAKENTTPKEVP